MHTAILDTEQETTIGGIEPLLGIDDVGTILRRTHWSIRRYVRDGRIVAIRQGGQLMFEPAEIRRFIASQPTTATA